jgi:hypothetical protein
VTGFAAEGYFAFDALIAFSPFGFEFYVAFGVSISAGSVTLMGVDVAANIAGPGLWEIEGSAKFELLGFEKKLEVDLTVGDRRSVSVPAYDVAALLAAALEDPANWTISDPAGASSIIARAPSEGETSRVAPGGTIAVVQRIAPLNLQLEKFGAGTIDGADRFDIEKTGIGDSDATFDPETGVSEWFAPAEYINYSDAEKLKAPSFELLDAGVEIACGDDLYGPARSFTPDYEEIVIDPALNQRRTLAAKTGPAAGLVTKAAPTEPESSLSLKPRTYEVAGTSGFAGLFGSFAAARMEIPTGTGKLGEFEGITLSRVTTFDAVVSD